MMEQSGFRQAVPELAEGQSPDSAPITAILNQNRVSGLNQKTPHPLSFVSPCPYRTLFLSFPLPLSHPLSFVSPAEAGVKG